MKFHDTQQDRRKDFVILAFHDAKAKDVADLEQKMQPLIEQVWDRDLPFPVLLDHTGSTVKTFGIRSFPTTVLIDPKGKVVEHGSLGFLKHHLLETSSEVKALVRLLKAARDPEKFAAALAAAKETGGEPAGFALTKFAERPSPPRSRRSSTP